MNYRPIITVTRHTDENNLLCDFCGMKIESRLASKTFECRSFEAMREPGLVVNLLDEWIACRVCAVHVDMGNKDALLERAVNAQAYLVPEMPRSRLVAEVRAIHTKFYNNRIQTH